MSQPLRGDQRKTLRSWFSPFFYKWLLGIKFKLQLAWEALGTQRHLTTALLDHLKVKCSLQIKIKIR